MTFTSVVSSVLPNWRCSLENHLSVCCSVSHYFKELHGEVKNHSNLKCSHVGSFSLFYGTDGKPEEIVTRMAREAYRRKFNVSIYEGWVVMDHWVWATVLQVLVFQRALENPTQKNSCIHVGLLPNDTLIARWKIITETRYHYRLCDLSDGVKFHRHRCSLCQHILAYHERKGMFTTILIVFVYRCFEKV